MDGITVKVKKFTISQELFLLGILILNPKTFHGNLVLVMQLFGDFLIGRVQFLIKKRERKVYYRVFNNLIIR